MNQSYCNRIGDISLFRLSTSVSSQSKSGLAIAVVACLKNLDALSLMIVAQKWTHDTLQDTKKNEWPEAYSGLQIYVVYIRLICKAYSHQLSKLQCEKAAKM